MGELLNLVGLSTGVVLYAMLLAMVLRAGRAGASGSDAARHGHTRTRLERLCAAGVRTAARGIPSPVSAPHRRRLFRTRPSARGRRPVGASWGARQRRGMG